VRSSSRFSVGQQQVDVYLSNSATSASGPCNLTAVAGGSNTANPTSVGETAVVASQATTLSSGLGFVAIPMGNVRLTSSQPMVGLRRRVGGTGSSSSTVPPVQSCGWASEPRVAEAAIHMRGVHGVVNIAQESATSPVSVRVTLSDRCAPVTVTVYAFTLRSTHPHHCFCQERAIRRVCHHSPLPRHSQIDSEIEPHA
jgi:hypothetical protein